MISKQSAIQEEDMWAFKFIKKRWKMFNTMLIGGKKKRNRKQTVGASKAIGANTLHDSIIIRSVQCTSLLNKAHGIMDGR